MRDPATVYILGLLTGFVASILIDNIFNRDWWHDDDCTP
jgi:hypothetical protein